MQLRLLSFGEILPATTVILRRPIWNRDWQTVFLATCWSDTACIAHLDRSYELCPFLLKNFYPSDKLKDLESRYAVSVS